MLDSIVSRCARLGLRVQRVSKRLFDSARRCETVGDVAQPFRQNALVANVRRYLKLGCATMALGVIAIISVGCTDFLVIFFPKITSNDPLYELAVLVDTGNGHEISPAKPIPLHTTQRVAG